MLNSIRLVMGIVECAVSTNKRHFVIINVGVIADVMNKSVNTIADKAIGEKLVQAVERSYVDSVEWKIRFAQNFRDFFGGFVIRLFEN